MKYELKPQQVEAVLFDGEKLSERPSWLQHLDIFVSNGSMKAYHPWFDELLFTARAGQYIYRTQAGGIRTMDADEFLMRFQKCK